MEYEREAISKRYESGPRFARRAYPLRPKKLNYALHRVGTLLYAGCFQAKRGRSFLHRSHRPWLMILIIHTLVEEALAIIFGVKRFYL